jgi:hypothetical protein
MESWDDWQPGPGGGMPPEVAEEFNRQLAPLRRFARLVVWSGVAVLVGLIALTALIAALIPHVVLVVLLIVVGAPILLLALATGLIAWFVRRAWRTGAWMEALPTVTGERGRRRFMRMLRVMLLTRVAGRSRRSPGGYAQYQAYPDGPWQQAPTGGSGPAS